MVRDKLKLVVAQALAEHDNTAMGRARQVQTVITGVVIVVAAALGIAIVSQFASSLGDPSSSALSTAQNTLFSGYGDMISLVGPLLLVLIAVPILGYIQRLRG